MVVSGALPSERGPITENKMPLADALRIDLLANRIFAR